MKPVTLFYQPRCPFCKKALGYLEELQRQEPVSYTHLEVIATDHAPHTAEQKSRGLAGSAMGIVGLECAFPLLYTYLVKPGLLTLEQLVERMSMAPRRIFGLGGGLQAGEPADLTVFDLDAEYEIDPETFLSKGRATPFAGWRVAGRTLWTLVGGRTAYATERFR